MRQRVMIAMAIANDPDVIVADEPTTALDVTIQAQVLEVLRTAREVTGAAILMITHDLSVIAGFADRVAVMYAGRMVETGTVDEVFYSPRMPYTMGLLGAIPRVDASGRRPLLPIEGDPPSLVELPPGCPFAPRCPLAEDACLQREPALEVVGAGAHRAACRRVGHIVDDEPRRRRTSSRSPPCPRRPPTRSCARTAPWCSAPRTSSSTTPCSRAPSSSARSAPSGRSTGSASTSATRETLGLVGESGCGKTTTLLEVLELHRPQEGRMVVLGSDTTELSHADRRALRRHVNVVFQDPLASLDPRLPVSDLLAEPLRTHGFPRAQIAGRVRELLRLVGLEPGYAARYPQQFSGGQRQRVAIARALALEPKLLVLDEPVSALDVSIQAGVVNLLADLQRRLGLSYLFVAHDLSVVRHIADRVAVMYLGRIVEIGEIERVYGTPQHPYTQALLSAIPLPDPRKERARRRIILEGDLPSPADPPSGCRFRTRCPKFAALDEASRQPCLDAEPDLQPVGDDQMAACHYAEVVQVV